MRPMVPNKVRGIAARYRMPPLRPRAPLSPRVEAVLVHTAQPCADARGAVASSAIMQMSASKYLFMM